MTSDSTKYSDVSVTLGLREKNVIKTIAIYLAKRYSLRRKCSICSRQKHTKTMLPVRIHSRVRQYGCDVPVRTGEAGFAEVAGPIPSPDP